MKRVLSILVLLLFISCNSSDSEMNNDSNAVLDANAIISFQGQFVSDAHPTSGAAKVNEAETALFFENFKTDSGPQLLVYLSTTVNSVDFVNLGALQGIDGNYSYNIPSNTDLSTYKYVVIWCVDFSVSFGHAELN